MISSIFDFNISSSGKWSKYQLSSILKERRAYCEKNGDYIHATLAKDGVYEKTERYDRDYLVSSDDKKYKITHKWDICYNPANLKFGVICLNTFGDAIFSPIYVTFEIDNDFDKEFVGYYLTRKNFINEALQYQQGTVYERMAVSPDDLLSLDFFAPSFSEQHHYAKALHIIETKIGIEEKTLTQLLRLKSSLLKQMLI